MGAVTGDHSFLKMVTRAKMNPPMKPTSISGATEAGLWVAANWFQVKPAEMTVRMSRMPVLLMVPPRVMAPVVTPPYWALEMPP